MAKDYANYRMKTSHQRVKSGWRGRLLLLLLLIGICAGGGYGWYLYKNQVSDTDKQQVVAWFKQVKILLSHKKIKQESTLPKVSEAKAESAEVQFNFYTELPAMQVTVPMVDAAPMTVSSSPAKKISVKSPRDQYVLQIGVFKNESAASQTRVSLMIAGFEADVVKSVTKNQTVYRIQQGPYASLIEAKNTQQQLKKKGILSLVKKID